LILVHLAAPPFGFIDLFFVREIWRQRRNQPIRQLCSLLVRELKGLFFDVRNG
jgi:hypothetical protein